MKYYLLQKFNNNEFLSGERLAKELGISRTAVWKQIKSLEELGYKFESKKHKGYRLISRPDIPIKEEIIPYINTTTIGSTYYHYSSVSSTNSIAKELIKKNVADGTVIIADKQMHGRGRKQRSWYSPKGGLWFSIIIYPDIPPQKAMYITMIASIAIVKALRKTSGLNVEIKWPNDLLINGKKICGILTELDAELDKIHYSIIGVGLNVNNIIPPLISSTAISLKTVTGSSVSRVSLFRSILSYVDDLYQNIRINDLASIRALWLHHADCIGKNVKIQGEQEIITGKIVGIDENGCLLLERQNKIIHIVSGDVEYI